MHKIHHMNHSGSLWITLNHVNWNNTWRSEGFRRLPTATARASSRQCGANKPLKAGTNVRPPVSSTQWPQWPQWLFRLRDSQDLKYQLLWTRRTRRTCPPPCWLRFPHPAHQQTLMHVPAHRITENVNRVYARFFSRTSWTVEPTFSSPSPGIHGVSSSPPWLEPETSPNWVLATRMAHQNMASPKMCLVSFTCFTTISTLSLWAFEEDMIPMLSRSHCTTRPAQATLPSKA